ncbi:hypothetical protein [Sphingobacterium hungaricum]
MEELYITEFDFERKIIIDESLSEYFKPIKIEGYNVDNPELKYEQKNYRIIKEKLPRLHFKINGDLKMHPDYDAEEYISRIMYKKSFDNLDEEELEYVNGLFSFYIELFALYKIDYWNNHYALYKEYIQGEEFSEPIEEVTELKDLLEFLENIEHSEIIIRLKDNWGNVQTDKTKKIAEHNKKVLLENYTRSLYNKWIAQYNLTENLTNEDVKQNVLSLKGNTAIQPVSEAIAILQFKDVKPAFSYSYFEELEKLVTSNTHFDKKLTPQYQFLKIAVPPLNKLIEDYSPDKYKKKDKHFLIFSILKIFRMVPDKEGLLHNGNEDVKEDFIKQMLR